MYLVLVAGVTGKLSSHLNLLNMRTTVGFTVFVSFAFPYLPYHAEKDWGISFYHKVLLLYRREESDVRERSTPSWL